MKRILFFSLVTLLISASCNTVIGKRIKGNGKITTENREAGNFEGVDVSAGIKVFVKQDSVESVKVETDENVQEYIITDVDNGILYIHPASNTNLRTTGSIKVYVSAKSLNSFEASSGSDIIGENRIVNETGISISASSAGSIQLEVKSPKITSDISSAATLRLAGETRDFSVDASSGADAKCYGLMTENTHVELSSGSGADVFASVKLTGSVSSGGGVHYKGNAVASVEKSSGGSVVKEN